MSHWHSSQHDPEEQAQWSVVRYMRRFDWRQAIEMPGVRFPFIALLNLFFILFLYSIVGNSTTFWPGTRLDSNSLHLPSRDPNPKARIQKADKIIITLVPVNSQEDSSESPHKQKVVIFFNHSQMDGLDQLKQRLTDAKEKKVAIERCVVLRADKYINVETLNELFKITRELNLDMILVTQDGKKEEDKPDFVLVPQDH